MSTQRTAITKNTFTQWIRRRLAPRPRKGDRVSYLDNLEAHKDPRFRRIIRARKAALVFLPPYSPDLNPIEPRWALVQKRLRRDAPRTLPALRAATKAARYAVKPNTHANSHVMLDIAFDSNDHRR